MAQTFNEAKIPFTNMSFTPDVPPQALGPNEYNGGYNVETDTRGIRGVSGDEYILKQLSSANGVVGTPIYLTSGYRGVSNQVYWLVFATVESSGAGHWYMQDSVGITEITPAGGLTGYYQGMPITEAWNGTVLFLMDSINAPMYLLSTAGQLRKYDVPYGDQTPNTYVWNYNPDWSRLSAGFMRLYSTPNVGSILVAGNLTADVISSGTTNNYPTTVRWSQAFGLNAGPTSWQPTISNTANELEVPVRGPVLDGFPMNGNFYVCSYWDTVIFSPINYTSTSAPILGVRLLNQGRGLLNENCWANADTLVYGLDARDLWSFDGSNFKPLGNQRVKNYFYQNLNPLYTDRVFVINNTQKNQIEIYYPDLDSTGWCNKMLAYRYDLDVFQSPRDVANASQATESPVWTGTEYNPASRTVIYSQGVPNTYLVQKDQGTQFIGNVAISSQFRRDNIQLLKDYSGQLLLHRILPEVINIDSHGVPTTSTGNITITVGGANSVGSAPTFKPSVTIPVDTNKPWTQINQNAYRINTLEISNTSNAETWLCSAVSVQMTQTQDAR
jgi:hypothetical protein